MIGVIVSEISTGVRASGSPSLIDGQKATSDPAQVYTAVFGAASVGLVMFGFVVGIEAVTMRKWPGGHRMTTRQLVDQFVVLGRVVVDHTSTVFNQGRSSQVDASADIVLVVVQAIRRR